MGSLGTELYVDPTVNIYFLRVATNVSQREFSYKLWSSAPTGWQWCQPSSRITATTRFKIDWGNSVLSGFLKRATFRQHRREMENNVLSSNADESTAWCTFAHRPKPPLYTSAKRLAISCGKTSPEGKLANSQLNP